MPQFFETSMGHRFYEGQVPKLISALERIADALEEQNKQEEPQAKEMYLKDILKSFNEDAEIKIIDSHCRPAYAGSLKLFCKDKNLYNRLRDQEVIKIENDNPFLCIHLKKKYASDSMYLSPSNSQ